MRYLLLLLLVFGSTYASEDCAPFNPSFNDIAALKKSGVLRVALHEKEAPWSWRDKQGHWTGYDVDLARFLARQLGVKLHFVTLRFHNEAELKRLIRKNKIDLASPEAPISINSREYLLVSQPYQTKALAILFKHVAYNTALGSQAIRLINQSNAVIGLLNNQQENDYVQYKMPQTKVIHYRTINALIAGIEKNRVNAIIGNYMELNRWLNQHPALRLSYQLLRIPNTNKGISLVTGPAHWRLLQWLNISLENQKNSNNTLFDKLKKKYLHSN